ncbi:adenine deaminase C-terminal domain-containing protein [Desulfoscipio gibsoniae]
MQNNLKKSSHKLRPLSRSELYDLIATARGSTPADLFIKDGIVINVYTGELLTANVAVKGRHIAYVGSSDSMIGEDTKVHSAKGQYLCPGYIEPHAHPFQTYNPITLAEKVMTLGTTTLVCDNLFFFMNMNDTKLAELWHEFATLPVKLLWSVRLDPQTYSRRRMERFDPQTVERLLNTPLARQVGELTDWPSLIAGQEQMLDNILTAGRLGKRVEGHAPGASVKTLNALAAGGITADHESITGEEALRRLRLGMYATLRHSSLRPDLPRLIQELLASGVNLSRIMITTDGVTPPSMRHGFTDAILRLAMQAGLPPVDAYRAATLNPAVYYNMDDELGGIAPGRLADILFLSDLTNPTPVKVLAEGRWMADNNRLLVELPQPNWRHYHIKPVAGSAAKLTPHDLIPVVSEVPHKECIINETALEVRERTQKEKHPTHEKDMQLIASTAIFPVMHLINPVITRRRDIELPVENGYLDISEHRNIVYAALLNREGNWVTNGLLSNFADSLDGLACSNTITGDILTLGNDPVCMLQAIERMYDMGGGLVVTEKGSIIYELPLPLGGIMSPSPVDKLIDRCSTLYKLLAERGHVHYDLLYTLLFLSATHLPELRLSPSGVLSVKDKKLLVPVKKTGRSL